MAAVALLLILFIEMDRYLLYLIVPENDTSSPLVGQSGTVAACLTRPSHVEAPVYRDVHLDVSLNLACIAPVDQSTNTTIRSGDFIRVEIFIDGPSEVLALSPNTQSIDPAFGANWSWQFNVQEPGTYQISLVATALDSQTNRPVFVNARQSMPLEISGSLRYYFETGLKKIGGVTTVLGVSGAAIIASAVTIFRDRLGSLYRGVFRSKKPGSSQSGRKRRKKRRRRS